MNRILATTAILALSAGFASAEVTLSGDARMGIIGGDGVDTAFTSRARVKFSMSGTTDGGLEFGASFRADNAGGAASGTAGSVYISGAFGKLSMGDVDPADLSAVGQVSGVGLTGLGDKNELGTDSNDSAPKPIALYEYSTGSFTGYLSYDNDATVAVGAKYATDTFSAAVGYTQDGVDDDTQVFVAGSATFGAVTAKAKFSSYDGVGTWTDGYALSLDYTADALTVTGFYKSQGYTFGDDNAYGIGAAYDLGGGASVVGGYVQTDSTFGDSSAFDLGLSFSF